MKSDMKIILSSSFVQETILLLIFGPLIFCPWLPVAAHFGTKKTKQAGEWYFYVFPSILFGQWLQVTFCASQEFFCETSGIYIIGLSW